MIFLIGFLSLDNNFSSFIIILLLNRKQNACSQSQKKYMTMRQRKKQYMTMRQRKKKYMTMRQRKKTVYDYETKANP